MKVLEEGLPLPFPGSGRSLTCGYILPVSAPICVRASRLCVGVSYPPLPCSWKDMSVDGGPPYTEDDLGYTRRVQRPPFPTKVPFSGSGSQNVDIASQRHRPPHSVPTTATTTGVGNSVFYLDPLLSRTEMARQGPGHLFSEVLCS